MLFNAIDLTYILPFRYMQTAAIANKLFHI